MRQRRGGLWLGAGLFLAVLAGVFAFLALLNATGARAVPAPPEAVKIDAVVAARVLPENTVVQSEDVVVKSIPRDLAPAGYAAHVEDVVGKVTTTDVASGEILQSARVVSPSDHPGTIPIKTSQGKVVMALPATDLMSSLNLLKPGDRVDILVSLNLKSVTLPSRPEDSTNEKAAKAREVAQTNLQEYPVTFDALQSTNITAVVVGAVPANPQAGEQGQQAQQGTTTVGQVNGVNRRDDKAAILLALEPHDALVIKNLKDADGVFDFVLRAPTDGQRYDVQAVDGEDILGQYQIAHPLLEPAPIQPGTQQASNVTAANVAAPQATPAPTAQAPEPTPTAQRK